MKYYEKKVLEVIDYFNFFSYPPTFEEIHTFFKIRMPKSKLQIILNKMHSLRLVDYDKNLKRYTLGEYSKNFKELKLKAQYSKLKTEKIKLYIKLLSIFPQIRLIGLSGTVAMNNARKEDDIDLFIITSKDRLWTGRFMAIVISYLLGVRRSYGQAEVRDKVCLNMFFDEKNLSIPKIKQNEYVAHEILQMKPIYVAGDTYKRFLKANNWVFRAFPNTNRQLILSKDQAVKKLVSSLGNLVEIILKRIQLRLINRHRTTELITDTQLWFFPDDFEKKILHSTSS